MSEIVVRKTEAIPADVIELAAALGLGEWLDAILDITREMYPGRVSVEAGYDPAWPEDRFVTLIVEVTGTMREFIDQQSKWHDSVEQIVPDHSGRIGLSFF